MTELEVKMGRVDKTYCPGDRVSGTITLRGAGAPVAHSGLSLRAFGHIRPHMEGARGAAAAAAGGGDARPIQLMDTHINMADAGKLPPDTPLPFEFVLAPLPGKALTDTYKGVYVSVRFAVVATLARSGFLAKPLEREVEFIVEVPCGEAPPPAPVEFEIKPESLENVKRASVGAIPKFSIKGKLKRTNCPLNAAFTGEVTVAECAARIKSIELQLVRVETIVQGGAQVARESTEIQNLQVGDGNVCKNLAIRLYMIFPRVFTCPTVVTETFKVEFEVRARPGAAWEEGAGGRALAQGPGGRALPHTQSILAPIHPSPLAQVNIIVVFEEGYMVTENHSIRLYRA
jgi:hypothetical protein